jgi:hypothetical protein
VTVNVHGSSGSTSQQSPEQSHEHTCRDQPRHDANEDEAQRLPSTRRSTDVAVAPRAMRTPISCVRPRTRTLSARRHRRPRARAQRPRRRRPAPKSRVAARSCCPRHLRARADFDRRFRFHGVNDSRHARREQHRILPGPHEEPRCRSRDAASSGRRLSGGQVRPART